MPNKSLSLAEEQQAFEKVLPDLMRDHAGKWVLFKGGRPIEFFPTSEAAYNAGMDQFGMDDVFLVAEIRPVTPEPVSISWELGVAIGF